VAALGNRLDGRAAAAGPPSTAGVGAAAPRGVPAISAARRIVIAALFAACCLILPATAVAHWKGIALEDNYTSQPSDLGFQRDLEWAQRAHLNIVHLYVRPAELGSRQDVDYLTGYLQTARHDGIPVLVTVSQNTYMIAHPHQFAQACAEVVRLWRSYLTAIEVGNEPNDSTADDIGYVRVLRAAYPAIKHVAPHLRVIAGALAYADGDALETMYAAGLHGYFDALSAHPYPDNAPPYSMGGGNCADSFACGVPWLHRIMSEHGDGDKRLWLTELGWATQYEAGAVSDWKRAMYMRQIGTMTRSWPWIGAVIFFHLRYGDPPKDQAPSERETDIGLALLSETWQPTAGFWALARTTY
jgi:hypothetical protein